MFTNFVYAITKLTQPSLYRYKSEKAYFIEEYSEHKNLEFAKKKTENSPNNMISEKMKKYIKNCDQSYLDRQERDRYIMTKSNPPLGFLFFSFAIGFGGWYLLNRIYWKGAE